MVFYVTYISLKIEKMFKFLIQSETDLKRKFCSWSKLTVFNRTYRLTGYPGQFSKFLLRISFSLPGKSYAVLQYFFHDFLLSI